MKQVLERTRPSFVVLILVVITTVLNIAVRSVSGLTQIVFFIAALFLMAYLCWASGMNLRSIGVTSGKLKYVLLWCVSGTIAIFGIVYLAYIINADWFLDSRYDRDMVSTLIYIFIGIPLLTVFFEELLFRGILWGYIRDHWNAKRATIVSSALFGLWHVLASRGMDKSFLIDAGIPKTAALPLLIGATVVATFCAGVLLCELRRRTESLWVPIIFHWAINASAVAMAYLAWH